jgi:hypothetical protein
VGRQREVYRVGAAEASVISLLPLRIGHVSGYIARDPELDVGISIPFSRSATPETKHKCCSRHHWPEVGCRSSRLRQNRRQIMLGTPRDEKKAAEPGGLAQVDRFQNWILPTFLSLYP